jgi:hypothetical protein
MANNSVRKGIEYLPPKKPENVNVPSIFLAGSIEMGKAIDWQTRFTEELSDLEVAVFNPRRTDWDSTWKQEIDFPPFREQVDWEMNQLEKASVIALYFQAGTMSPISLLELGLHAASKRLIVCCPPGFWRRGNVQIVCDRYGITIVDELDELIKACREKLIEHVNSQTSA